LLIQRVKKEEEEEEKKKKAMEIDAKPETHLIHALPHRLGGQDLSKTTLKDGVG